LAEEGCNVTATDPAPSLSVRAPQGSRCTPQGVVYSRRGVGPTIILLHGWCLNRAMWTYQEAALIDAYDVVCPDMPGFGASWSVPGPYDLPSYARSLSSLIDDLAVDAVRVAGFAFGAAVALAAVQAGESRIRALALVAPPSAATAPYERMPKAMRRDWPQFAQRSAESILKQAHSEATMRWLGEMFGATPLSVALATVQVLAQFEPAKAAQGVDVPALLIHGEQDDIVPLSVSEQCAAVLGAATLARVPESGHLVPIDQKEQTARLLAEFFALPS
jgi:non-heme chloroperoxidase